MLGKSLITAGKAFGNWARYLAGYVCLLSLDAWAAGVTEDGDIALFVEGHLPFGSGQEERAGQFLLSRNEAMNIAQTLVRAVALADAQASAPQVMLEPEKQTRVKAQASSPIRAVVPRPIPDCGRPATTIFF